MRLHEENNIKHCHYFNNAKSCPYEKLGCKFLHTIAKKCEFRSKCARRLCPFRHEEIESTRNVSDDMTDDSETDDNDNFAMNLDSFVTSTPQEKSIKCEDCANRTQCTDCYVRQMTRHISFTDNLIEYSQVHFSDNE
jgi:hypothetical protein